MLRLLADEHVDPRIVSAVKRRNPDVAFLRLQDAGLRTRSDTTILAWAAEREFVVVTCDYATMHKEASDRMALLIPMPGVIVLHEHMPIGPAAEQLLTLAVAGRPGDLEGQVIYLLMV